MFVQNIIWNINNSGSGDQQSLITIAADSIIRDPGTEYDQSIFRQSRSGVFLIHEPVQCINSFSESVDLLEVDWSFVSGP